MGFYDLPNAEETFAGLVTAFGNTVGKNTVKIKLENLGDEAYLWKGKNAGFVMIQFRKSDIFVDVFTASEIAAKRFARYVVEQIPKN